MKTYARIQDGVVAELFETDGNIAEMFHPSLEWVDATATAGIAVGWTYQNSTFAAPVASVTQAVALLKAQALALLNESDKTIIRCVEHGVAVPAAWVTYRAALRTLVTATTGDPSQIPQKPTYPTNT